MQLWPLQIITFESTRKFKFNVGDVCTVWSGLSHYENVTYALLKSLVRSWRLSMQGWMFLEQFCLLKTDMLQNNQSPSLKKKEVEQNDTKI